MRYLKNKLEDYRKNVWTRYQTILNGMQVKKDDSLTQDNSTFFGVLKNIPDGMDIQRSMRDEWE